MIPASTEDHSTMDWASGNVFSFGAGQNEDDFTITNPDLTNINNDDTVIRLKNPVIPLDFSSLPQPSSHLQEQPTSSASISVNTDFHKPGHSSSYSFSLSDSFPQASPLISPRTNSLYGSEDTDNTTGLFNISTTSPATSFSITTPDVSPHIMPDSQYDIFHPGPVVFPSHQRSEFTTSPPITPLSLEQKFSLASNNSPHHSTSSTSPHDPQLQVQQGFLPIHFQNSAPTVVQDILSEGSVVFLLSPEGAISCVSSNSEALLGRTHESQKNTPLSVYLYHGNQNDVMCNKIIKNAISTGKRFAFDFFFKHGLQEAYVPLRSTCFALYNLDLTASAGDIMSLINNLYNSYVPSEQEVKPELCKGVIFIATPNLQATFKNFDVQQAPESQELDQDPTITTITTRPHDGQDDTMLLNTDNDADNNTQTQNLNITNPDSNATSSQNLWLRRKAKELGVDPSQYALDMSSVNNMGLNLGTNSDEGAPLTSTNPQRLRFGTEEPLSAVSNLSSLPSAPLSAFSPITNIPSSAATVPPSAFTHFTFPDANSSLASSTSSSPSVRSNSTNAIGYSGPYGTGSLDDLSIVNVQQRRATHIPMTNNTAIDMTAAQAAAVANGSAGMARGQTTTAAVGPHGFEFTQESKLNGNGSVVTLAQQQQQPFPPSFFESSNSSIGLSTAPQNFTVNPGFVTTQRIPSPSHSQQNSVSSISSFSSTASNTVPPTNNTPNSPGLQHQFLNSQNVDGHSTDLTSHGHGRLLHQRGSFSSISSISSSSSSSSSSIPATSPAVTLPNGLNTPNSTTPPFWNPTYTGPEKILTSGPADMPMSTDSFQQQQQLQLLHSMGIQHPSQMTAQQQQQYYNTMLQQQQAQQQAQAHMQARSGLVIPQQQHINQMQQLQFQAGQQMMQKRVLQPQQPPVGMSMAGMNLVGVPMNMNIMPGMNPAMAGMNGMNAININMNQFYAANGGNPSLAIPPGTAITTNATGFRTTAGPPSTSPFASLTGGAAVVRSSSKRKDRFGAVRSIPGGPNGISANGPRGSRGTTYTGHVCTECHVEESPEWRKGPKGPKTLCNACGLRWAKKSRKESQRAAEAAAAAEATGANAEGHGGNNSSTVKVEEQDTKDGLELVLEDARNNKRMNSISSISSLSSTDSKASEELIITTPKRKDGNDKRSHGLGAFSARLGKTSATLTSALKGDFGAITKSKSQGSSSTAAIPASALTSASSSSSLSSNASSSGPFTK